MSNLRTEFDVAADPPAGMAEREADGQERRADAGRGPRLRWAAALAALALCALYAALIFARLWPPDFRSPSEPRVALSVLAFYTDTFMFHGGLAALLLAGGLAAIRRWGLCLAALPAIAFALGPELWPHRVPVPSAEGGRGVTVMSANLLGSNQTTDGLVEEIRAADADIVFIQEYTEHWHAAIRDAVGARYPHSVVIPQMDNFGMAIYSKLPFKRAPERLRLAGLSNPCLQMTVDVDGTPVTFVNVHIMPPRGLSMLRAQAAQVADLLDRVATAPRPTVLVGDFNFTWRSRFAGAVAALGFRDVHDLAGTGRGSTWPVDGPFRYVPGVRIDHVYLSPGLTCASSRTGIGQGSDHRPIVARIGVER